MDRVSDSFEWDVEKDQANIRKHGIGFEKASRAFLDPKRKIYKDSKHSAVEPRFFCIGKVAGRVLTVRFVRRGERIRIIGAGYWRKGRAYYEKED